MTHNIVDRWTYLPIGQIVEMADLVQIEEAYPTSRCLGNTGDCWAETEYVVRMWDPVTEKHYDVIYLFSASDMEGEDCQLMKEEDYPFDEEHVARVFAVYDDDE